MRITLEDTDKKDLQTAENRPLTDEERKATQKQRFAQMSTEEKLHWLRDYYTIPAILTVAVIVFIVLITKDIRSNKPDGFYAEFINSGIYEAEALKTDIAEALAIDPNEEFVTVSVDQLSAGTASDTSTMYAAESIMVRIAAGEIDVIAADDTYFAQYARGGAYADLREQLSPEELAAWEPLLVYAQEEIQEGVFGDEIPYGIRLDNAPGLEKYGNYPNGGVIGIVANTKRSERAVRFLHFLLD